MATVTVVYGPAYDEKHEECFQACLRRMLRGEGRSCVYLVRTEVRMQQLRQRLLRQFSGAFQFPVVTFPDFIKRLYRQRDDTKRYISGVEQQFCIEEILARREQVSGGNFPFAGFREHPGMIVKILEWLTALRRNGIASRQMLDARQSRHVIHKQQLYDELLRVFEAYVEHLDSADMIDETGIFLEMARNVEQQEQALRQLVPCPDFLALEGYYDLTPLEQEIFTQLSARFDQTRITIDTPFSPYMVPNSEVLPKPFRIFHDFMPYLRTLQCSVREYTSSPLVIKTTTDPAQGNGVTYDMLGISTLSEDRLSITSYRDRKQEVSEIARTIRLLHRDGNIDGFHQVGVAFPVIEHYDGLIREIFPQFGLPFTMFQGHALAASPVVVTLFHLLQVLLDDYSRESLLHLFASPLTHYDGSETSDFIPAMESAPLSLSAETYLELDSLARRIDIRSGQEAWRTQLTQAFSEADDLTPTCRLTIPTLLHFLERLVKWQAAAPCSFDVHLDHFRDLLRLLHIPQHVFQTRQRGPFEQDVVALRTVFGVLDTLQEVFSVPHRCSRLFTLEEWGQVLHDAVQREVFYLPAMPGDSVFVLGRLDTRQVRFRYLFFGGLVERDFPGQAEPNIFLSEQEAAACGFPTYQTQVEEIAHLFYLTLCNPREKLYLSYPRQEGDTELLRSAYIERVMGALQAERESTTRPEQTVPVYQEARESWTSESPDRLCTVSELLHWLGARCNTNDSALQASLPRLLPIIRNAKGAAFVQHFLKGIQVQRRRNGMKLSGFDGMLQSEWGQHRIQRRYARHVYSAKEFDLYVRCPMRFFFQQVLGIFPIEEALPQLSPVCIGQLLHRIMYRFYASAADETQGIADAAFVRRKQEHDAWIAEARERMRDIVQTELAGYDLSGAFGTQFQDTLLAGLVPGKGDGKQGLLAAFIQREANDRDVAVPTYLEAHFGMNSPHRATPQGFLLTARPYKFSMTDDKGKPLVIRLRGEIDRIDLVSESGDEPRCGVVYDYKTGRVPSVQYVLDGMAFQLPLYCLAAQDVLGEDVRIVAGGYYQIRSAQDLGKKGHLGSKDYAEQRCFSGYRRYFLESHADFAQLLETYKGHACRVAQQIQAGAFPPTTRGAKDGGCDYCEYVQICRVDHQRMSEFDENSA